MSDSSKKKQAQPPSREAAGGRSQGSGAGPHIFSPRHILLPYQDKWMQDKSRFKIGLWPRQAGKDFTSNAEAVEDCILNPGTLWVILATGERQALESMEKSRNWAEIYKLAIEAYTEDRAAAEAVLKSAEIRWGNGSRIIALPANPSTARGYSANLILTEFAFHEDPTAIWRAIYPSITNPLAGLKKIRIISTPNGLNNKFADIWNDGGPRWSRHKLTIYDAVAQGLGVDIDELREALNDPEAWAQEYECEFLDAATVLLPYELMAPCEHLEATETRHLDWFRSGPPTSKVMGLDVGRKKDLTVAWTDEILGDVAWAREVLALAGMPIPDQHEILRPRIQAVRRVCLDYTGVGIGLGDLLVKEFGEWKPEAHKFGKIELCNFTNEFKCEIFPKLRLSFENRSRRIPVSRVIREDLHSINRGYTKGGRITYHAPSTKDGHADRCNAAALAERARSFNAGPIAFSSANRHGTRSRELGGLGIRRSRRGRALV